MENIALLKSLHSTEILNFTSSSTFRPSDSSPCLDVSFTVSHAQITLIQDITSDKLSSVLYFYWGYSQSKQKEAFPPFSPRLHWWLFDRAHKNVKQACAWESHAERITHVFIRRGRRRLHGISHRWNGLKERAPPGYVASVSQYLHMRSQRNKK